MTSTRVVAETFREAAVRRRGLYCYNKDTVRIMLTTCGSSFFITRYLGGPLGAYTAVKNGIDAGDAFA